MRHNELLREKVYESVTSVLPITIIVLFLSITVAPLSPGILTLFLFGAALLIIGMGFFTLGVDMSMIPMGEGVGVQLSKARKIGIPFAVCFVLGILITLAEPDLQVLAQQVPAIPNLTLILTVAVGVGACDCTAPYFVKNSSFLYFGFLLWGDIHSDLLCTCRFYTGFF